VIELGRRIQATEPILDRDAHDLSAVVTDARLDIDPLKAGASEEFGFVAAGKAFSLCARNGHYRPRIGLGPDGSCWLSSSGARRRAQNSKLAIASAR
jgi:hypothetical protein